MKLSQSSLRALFISLLAVSPTLVSAANPGKIPLSRVKSLVLRAGAKTTGRRNSPIPQLKCVGGDAKGLYEVDVMRCQNMGSDYDDDGDASWQCTADLPKWFKLGSTDVLCEGYSNPDDPYILKGSCGVEYRLLLTDAGHQKYPDRKGWSSNSNGDGKMDWSDYLFFLLFFGVLAFIVYAGCTGTTPPEGRRPGGNRPGFGGGGGGYGGGGPGDPPPPYDYKPSSPPNQQQGWRPGFWTGLATGAAARHFMPSGDGNRQSYRNRAPFDNIYHRGGEPGDGGLFGGGSRRSGGYDDGDPGSSSRVSSTGYGQTRRR